jgi:ribosomal protein S18 acetylase RimI-like enzyme
MIIATTVILVQATIVVQVAILVPAVIPVLAVIPVPAVILVQAVIKMESKDLHFVQGRPDQYDIALDLYYKAAYKLKMNNVQHWQFWLDPPQERVDAVKTSFAKGEYYFVYNEADVRVGMFRLIFRDPYFWGDMDEDGWYIHALVTDPQYSGQEIGKATLRKIESMAMEQGVKLLRLDCNAANPFLSTFYESMGFVKMGQKQIPVSLNNLYQKTLTKVITESALDT